MRVTHPVALSDDGHVDSTVYVNGDAVPVDDDGTFEVDDEHWLESFADRYGYDVADLRVDYGGTCDTVKSDGDVCGRDLPCPYHSED